MTGTNQGTLEGGPVESPPTAKAVDIDGIVVGRYEDGKLVEEYTRSDSLRALQQPGLLGSGSEACCSNGLYRADLGRSRRKLLRP